MGLTEIKKKKATNSSKEAAKAVTKANSSTPAPSKDGQANQIRESDVAKMKGQEFEKNEEAIKEAIRSGNFIYDISRPSA
jgi:anti-sigma28 factor (negative regulator of flagellin synthesis)